MECLVSRQATSRLRKRGVQRGEAPAGGLGVSPRFKFLPLPGQEGIQDAVDSARSAARQETFEFDWDDYWFWGLWEE
ncbi:MAG: hypothetical protein HW388_946 [Dehalococcoidia bacterium]|nr:hypothetical protein [Dehalococcoidia bacterium]